MDRRGFLAVVGALGTGCLSRASGSDDPHCGTATPSAAADGGSPTASAATGDREACELHNAVVDAEHATVVEAYAFADLSVRAQRVFLRALRDGRFSFRYDGGNAPDEFRYGDQTADYEVSYCGDVHRLRTYTYTGCVVD